MHKWLKRRQIAERQPELMPVIAIAASALFVEQPEYLQDVAFASDGLEIGAEEPFWVLVKRCLRAILEQTLTKPIVLQ